MIRDSTLEWTIFRPSLIFAPGSEFVHMISEVIRRLPVVPVIGDGQYRMQPVSRRDVATSFVKALEMPATIGKTYNLGGGESYSYDEILDLTSQAMGKGKASKIHQPLFVIKPMIRPDDLDRGDVNRTRLLRRIAKQSRDMQRRLALFVFDVDLRALVDEIFDHLDLMPINRRM